MARNLNREPAARGLVFNLIVGTLPAVVIGLPTEKWIEAHFFRPVPVALAFVLGGAILLIERWYSTPAVESVDRIPMKKALGVGLIQVLAIIFPGTSRSGATIIGGLAFSKSCRHGRSICHAFI